MSTTTAILTFLPLLLLLHSLSSHGAVSHVQREEAIGAAREHVARATSWARSSLGLAESDRQSEVDGAAWRDCVQLYEDSEDRLTRLVSPHVWDDARTWLSAALTSHMTCLDSLRERNSFVPVYAENVTVSLRKALPFYALPKNESGMFCVVGRYRMPGPSRIQPENNIWSFFCPIDIGTEQWKQMENQGLVENQGLLASWEAAAWRADFVVAKDGSGNYKTINEAVAALARRGQSRSNRVVIYVKSGVYPENVEIRRGMKNVMFVGDGMDKTIVTSNRNVPDGATTFGSATFGVSADGFWARDMTFENTAGPAKHQAVALRVGSDLSVFYRCSFRGYQDTLFVHSQRQFYRDCHIYGTIDFIFGNAAAVLQNCDIHVRRPMGQQSNMITAQGRTDPNQNTGISIHASRVTPALDFQDVKGSFRTFLGRPWKKFSRTVFMKTDLDGLIDPRGWTEWSGGFALSTLYYGEYVNYGKGAVTSGRVKWPGFHVLRNPSDADHFTVQRFIQGETWIPGTGVPFIPGL